MTIWLLTLSRYDCTRANLSSPEREASKEARCSLTPALERKAANWAAKSGGSMIPYLWTKERSLNSAKVVLHDAKEVQRARRVGR